MHEVAVRQPGGQKALGIDGPASRRVEWNLDDPGALDPRRDLVHAEGGRALQNRIGAGTQIDARQEIDVFIAAVRLEHARGRYAVDSAQALDEGPRLGVRLTMEACRRGVARGTPSRLL